MVSTRISDGKRSETAAAATSAARALGLLLLLGLGLGLGLGGRLVAGLPGDDGVDELLLAQAAEAVDAELVGQ
jgi:hypothetical protein